MKKIQEIAKISDVLEIVIARPGLRAVFFDIDNTLTASHSQEIDPEVAQLLTNLSHRNLQMALISNNSRQRAAVFARQLGLPYYYKARKPLPFALRRAARERGLLPHECLFVGDQIITDILAALLARMEGVLVYPYNRASDSPWQNFFSRRIERHLFRRKI